MDHGSSIITQQIAEHYLRSGMWEKHMDKVRYRLKERRRMIIDALSANCGDDISFITPKGGYHLWCRLKSPVSDSKLLESAIDRSVLFVPGTMYGAHPRYARLSYACTSAKNITEGALRFIQAVRQASCK
jgi:DNA-binding transcriptional MocR family regulator